MSKKILSIVLSVVMLMSVLVVGASAAITNYENAVKWTLCCTSFGNTRTDSQIAALVEEYEKADPDIFERNLQFWDDSVITAYHNATTNQDWKNLYNDMRGSWVEIDYDGEMESLEDYYAAKVNVGKAKVDIKYTTDVDYAMPGDTITVTLSAKTNFYFSAFGAGLIYDKTKLDYIEGSSTVVSYTNWVTSGDEIPDYGFINSTGKDQRSFSWPAAYRDNENGEYAKWGMVKRASTFDATVPVSDPNYITGRILEDWTPMFTFQFRVREIGEQYTNEKQTATATTALNDVLEFFSIEGTYKTIDELPLHEEIGTCPSLNEVDRVCSPKINVKPHECYQYDHVWTFQNATVTVGEEPAPGEPADYTALEAAINAFDEAAAADYTAASWSTYADAVAAGQQVSPDLTSEDQAIIDNAAAAITGAKTALVKNAVKSAEVVGEPVLGSYAKINVKVDGEPELLKLVKGTASLTFARDNAEIIENTDGTETWTVKVLADSESASYDVYAKYVNYTDDCKTVSFTAKSGLDLAIHSIRIPDMYPDGLNDGGILKGKHTIIITTSQDVYKIQFVQKVNAIAEGATYTYSVENPSGNCTYKDLENGEREWTLTHSFGPMGAWSMPIRTRAESTTFDWTGDYLKATVYY